MDSGELVPDSVIIGVVLERIAQDDARDGFLLDGFPRTVAQADALGREIEKLDRRLTAALLIEVPDEIVVKRISGRRTNPKTGRIYHVDFDPPQQDGICDEDGTPLIQRDDDREQTVRKRLAVYHEQTEPLIHYYDEQGLLRRFDGTGSQRDVHDPHSLGDGDAEARGRARPSGKSPAEIEKIAAAGAILVKTLRLLERQLRPGVTTAELDAAAERLIRSQGAEPTFKGYRGFPGSICASPNAMIVHGIPGPYALARGDVIALDVGVTLDGWVADAARTFPVGQSACGPHHQRKPPSARSSRASSSASPATALAMSRTRFRPPRRARGLQIVRALVGHGVPGAAYEDPQIPNFGKPGTGRASRTAWSSRSSR